MADVTRSARERRETQAECEAFVPRHRRDEQPALGTASRKEFRTVVRAQLPLPRQAGTRVQTTELGGSCSSSWCFI